MALVMFVHILGTALWIGGGVAGMLIASSAGEEPAAVKAGAFRILARLHRGLKSAFDPEGILNPGRLYPDF